MADRADRAGGGRRMAGGPLPARNRKRWAIAAVVAVAWLGVLSVSGSVLASLLVLLLAAMFAAVVAVALRSLGVGRDHPVIQALGTRPWRDGREVLALALRHLSEVFIVTPHGSRLAPSAVELCMNPADVASLADLIDLDLVNASAAEAYEAEIAASGAQVRLDLPVEVSVVADPAVPAGRYALRQRRPGAPHVPAAAAAAAAGFRGSLARRDPPPIPPPIPPPALPATEALTVDVMAGAPPARPSASGHLHAVPSPLLRLVTGSSVTQTRVSGARAGRGQGTELTLPDDLTLSRVHATFTCARGEWRISGAGRNGLLVNGAELAGEEVIRDGDVITWGRRPDALSSQVEILR